MFVTKIRLNNVSYYHLIGMCLHESSGSLFFDENGITETISHKIYREKGSRIVDSCD